MSEQQNTAEQQNTSEQQAKNNKLKHFDHPGWSGFRDLFYSNSVDIRPVPPDQYKLVYEIPGWNLSQRSQTTSMSERMLEQNTSSICKDKETPKLKHFDHPGWNGFRDLFHSDSVDIRTVPTEYKLVLDSRTEIEKIVKGW
ncbi:unnamed protein product [Rhizophagus irregularis]|uniref:Uncharacterized protein n=1 Tax=Rhizophagus irregularis TaxID=588596 RepID=A0A915YNH8_9GLOM|nr:unnamed protein product [Rhizophagus irregularis]